MLPKLPLLLIVLMYSFFLSLWLVFQNPLLDSYFALGNVDWYANYAKTIFHPEHLAKVLYWGESILMPLIGNLVGASQTFIAYKVFCATLLISILPALALLCQLHGQNSLQTLLVVIIFGFSFQLLQTAGLGYPDPLTILLLITAALSRNKVVIFLALSLAALSHFSMAAVGAIALSCLFFTSFEFDKKNSLRFGLSTLAGLFFGRALLELWYRHFEYMHTNGRLEAVLDKGISFFTQQYVADIWGFWLTPGIPFLIVYSCILLYLLIYKHYLFACAAVIALMLSYGVLFFTVDGLRGFAVTIVPAYVFLLATLSKSLFNKTTSTPRSK